MTCSGHGTCAVTAAGTAICICDPGYHAGVGGLTCEENVVGDECRGVDCSGHGSCVVVNADPDYPLCLCDDGYRNEGNTNCVEDPGGVTCGAGTHLEGGVCVPDDTEHPPADWTRVGDGISHPGPVHMSPDGSYLVYAPLRPLGGDLFEPTTIRVRNIGTGDERDAYDAVLGCATGGCAIAPALLGFSPDSRYAAFGASWLGQVVYELPTGVKTALPEGSGFLSFAPDSRGFVGIRSGGIGYVSLPDLSTHPLIATGGSSHEIVLGFFSDAGGTQVVASVPMDGSQTIVAVPIEGGSSVVLAEDVLGGTYARGSMAVSSRGYVIYQSGAAARTTVYSVPISGGTPIALGQASGSVVVRLALSPDGRSVFVTDPDSSQWYVVPVEGGERNVLGATTGISHCRWAGNDSLVCYSVGHSLVRYPLPSGPSELIADGVNDFMVRGSRLLYAKRTGSTTIFLVQGAIRGGALLQTNDLFFIRDGVERLLWRDVETSPGVLGLSGMTANESLTLAALKIMYFDVMRDYAPGPNNGLWLVPLP